MELKNIQKKINKLILESNYNNKDSKTIEILNNLQKGIQRFNSKLA